MLAFAAAGVLVSSATNPDLGMSVHGQFGQARHEWVMNPMHRLMAGGLLAAAAIGYLAYLGGQSSWQYYLSVDEAIADQNHLSGKRVRVSGRVVAGTLTFLDDRRTAMFELAGEVHTLHTICCCTLPDNLAEEVDVVVEGRMQADTLQGHKLITRCASKYQPAGAPVDLAVANHKSDRH